MQAQIIITPQEFRNFTGATNNLTPDDLQDSIKTILNRNIIPLVSLEQYNTSKANNNELHTTLIYFAKKAISLLAVHRNYSTFDVQLEKGGLKNKAGKESKATKEEKEEHKALFLSEGLATIDDMLQYLETHKDDFQEWKSSEAYTILTNSLVNNTGVFQEFVNINNSRATFLRLKPHIRKIEDLELSNIIAPELYETLLDSYKEKNQTELKMKLTGYLQAIIVNRAMADAMLKSAIIKDKYNTFTTYDDTGLNKAQGHKTADLATLKAIASEFFDTAKQYQDSLNTIIEANITELGLAQEELKGGFNIVNQQENGYFFM